MKALVHLLLSVVSLSCCLAFESHKHCIEVNNQFCKDCDPKTGCEDRVFVACDIYLDCNHKYGDESDENYTPCIEKAPGIKCDPLPDSFEDEKENIMSKIREEIIEKGKKMKKTKGKSKTAEPKSGDAGTNSNGVGTKKGKKTKSETKPKTNRIVTDEL